jgi:hypothetical protein
LILLIFCDQAKRIILKTPLLNGSNVDFGLFKKYFSNISFKGKRVHVDLGFQGILKFMDGADVSIPIKKKKNSILSEEDKAFNKKCASERVLVEHCIGGIKRYFFLTIKNRTRNRNIISECADVCIGLWNFRNGFEVKIA